MSDFWNKVILTPNVLWDGFGSGMLTLLFGSLLLPRLIERRNSKRALLAVRKELHFADKIMSKFLNDAKVDERVWRIPRTFGLKPNWETLKKEMIFLLTPDDFLQLANFYDTYIGTTHLYTEDELRKVIWDLFDLRSKLLSMSWPWYKRWWTTIRDSKMRWRGRRRP